VRVGVVGPQGPDDFADNVSSTLDDMGVANVRLGSATVRPRGRFGTGVTEAARLFGHDLDDHVQRRLIRTALDRACDIVLTVDANLTPTSVATLRAAGVKTALWFPDAVSNLGKRQLLFLAPYDAVFFKEPRLVERSVAVLGLPAHYLPEACNPRWHRPLGEYGERRHIVVAGNMYPTRVKLLERLLADGIPLEVFGGPFPRWLGDHPLVKLHTGRYIVREEKARVFREAVAVLNNLHPVEIDGVNCRLFEATGSGAVVLSEHRAALPTLFEPQREVLVFRDYDELISQTRLLLSEPEGFAPVADAAAQRAHVEHTYAHRLTDILERIA
jgi:spore maturation protein CgeB